MVVIKRRRKSGYVVVKGYDESRWGKSNEALEHRKVVEDYIGQILPKGSVVHHIDKKRDHNEIENLLLLQSQQIHMLLHSYMDKGQTKLIQAMELWSRNWMNELRSDAGLQKLSMNHVESVEDAQVEVVLDGKKLRISVSSLLQQYLDIKLLFPSHLCLIQFGCFYSVYEDDANTLKKVLGYKTFECRFTGLVGAGTSGDNAKFLSQLQLERIPYVRVVQSSRVRVGRVLSREVEEVFTPETAVS